MDCAQTPGGAAIAATVEMLTIVVDVSKSQDNPDWIPSRLAGVKDALVALIDEKAVLRPQDHLALVSFSRRARLELPPMPVGPNADRMRRAVGALRTRGVTNIASGLEAAGAALYQALGRLGPAGRALRDVRGGVANGAPVDDSAAAEVSARLAIVSDGYHGYGKDPVPVARRLKERGVQICAFGIGQRPSDVDEQLLRLIASTRAGQPLYWFVTKSELLEAFRQIATGLPVTDSPQEAEQPSSSTTPS